MKKIQYLDENHTISEWAEILKLSQKTIRYRLKKYPNDIEKVFSVPFKRYEYNGQFYTIKELEIILSISKSAIYKRLRSGTLNGKKSKLIQCGNVYYTPTEFAKTFSISRTLVYYYLDQFNSGKISNVELCQTLLSRPRKERK